MRRAPFLVLLALVLAFGVFGGLATVGEGAAADFSAVHPSQLFLLHVLFLATLAIWYGLGFAGHPPAAGTHGRELAAQLGLRSSRLDVELGIGVLAGVGGWVVVLVAMVVVGLVVYAARRTGGVARGAASGDRLDRRPAGRRCGWPSPSPRGSSRSCSSAASCSRVSGSPAPPALFVLAHLSYDQPLMLVGITLLSLLYGALVVWRQSLWAAILAHILFDAIQLVVVIPLALRFLPPGGGGPA